LLRRSLRGASYIVTTSDVTPSHRERLSTTLLQPKLSTLSGCTVETENLSVRVFPLACFLGQPKSLQSRDLFTNNLCLDFVAHRESVLPRSLLQPRLHSHVFRISGHGALLLRAQKRDPIAFIRNMYVFVTDMYARNTMKKGPAPPRGGAEFQAWLRCQARAFKQYRSRLGFLS
jgi:hypothetical protein